MQWDKFDDMVSTKMPKNYSHKVWRLMHKLVVDVRTDKWWVNFNNLWNLKNSQTFCKSDNYIARGFGYIQYKQHRRSTCYKIIEEEIKIKTEEEDYLYEVFLTNNWEVVAKSAPE